MVLLLASMNDCVSFCDVPGWVFIDNWLILHFGRLLVPLLFLFYIMLLLVIQPWECLMKLSDWLLCTYVWCCCLDLWIVDWFIIFTIAAGWRHFISIHYYSLLLFILYIRPWECLILTSVTITLPPPPLIMLFYLVFCLQSSHLRFVFHFRILLFCLFISYSY